MANVESFSTIWQYSLDSPFLSMWFNNEDICMSIRMKVSASAISLILWLLSWTCWNAAALSLSLSVITSIHTYSLKICEYIVNNVSSKLVIYLHYCTKLRDIFETSNFQEMQMRYHGFNVLDVSIQEYQKFLMSSLYISRNTTSNFKQLLWDLLFYNPKWMMYMGLNASFDEIAYSGLTSQWWLSDFCNFLNSPLSALPWSPVSSVC